MSLLPRGLPLFLFSCLAFGFGAASGATLAPTVAFADPGETECEATESCGVNFVISGTFVVTGPATPGSCVCNGETCLTQNCNVNQEVKPSISAGSLKNGEVCWAAGTQKPDGIDQTLTLQQCGGNAMVSWQYYAGSASCTGTATTWLYKAECDLSDCGGKSCQ